MTLFARLPQAVFCSRTLNFRAIQAIGYDLDYTLIHYGVKPAHSLRVIVLPIPAPCTLAVDAPTEKLLRLPLADVEAWEGSVYKYGLDSLKEAGCNVDGLRFDSKLVIRGLIIDKQKGNLVKVDRFG